MGIFGGGDDDNPAQDQANYLLTEQINQNKDELEQKRQSLVDQRVNIIKSQGGENWVPNRNAAYSGSDASSRTPGSGGKIPGNGFWNGYGRWK